MNIFPNASIRTEFATTNWGVPVVASKSRIRRWKAAVRVARRQIVDGLATGLIPERFFLGPQAPLAVRAAVEQMVNEGLLERKLHPSGYTYAHIEADPGEVE